MLLWAGLLFILAGIACIAIDRAAAHAFYDHIGARFHKLLEDTTHLAKAAHWLAAAVIAFLGAEAWLHWMGKSATAALVVQCAEAFVASLALGSAVLHGTKLLLGRRRPRDEMEMKLYGFVPFAFNLDLNSFPSGHALTIMCVAVIATSVWPHLAVLWFAIALWLGLTRALLTAHFLSDVLVGAGVGLISARIVLVHFFPQLVLPWY